MIFEILGYQINLIYICEEEHRMYVYNDHYYLVYMNNLIFILFIQDANFLTDPKEEN